MTEQGTRGNALETGGRVGLAIGVALVAVFGACLADLPPDLPPHLPPDASSPDAAKAAGAGCGDGYIDLDAGETCDFGAAGAANGVCSAACKVICRGGFVWRENAHCYQLMGAATNLDPDAVDRCAGGHVATFASRDELAAVVATADASTFWVGLTTSASRPFVSLAPYEPGWAPACPGCFARTANPSGPLPRAVIAGLDAAPNEPCVVMFVDGGGYKQFPCANAPPTAVVCEREPLGVQFAPCDAGICVSTVITHDAKRYVYRGDPASPTKAAATCAALGGRLVVFQSADEREQLWRQLSLMPAPPERFWIGLQSQAEGGPWVWDDGTVATTLPSAGADPSPWGLRQPVSAGAVARAYVRHAAGDIDDTLARNDEPEGSLPYVCELPIATP